MCEREFPIAAAEEKISQVASSLSLVFSTKYADRSKAVASSSLINGVGVTVAEGAGKGVHSAIGAQAECLEHYAFDHLSSQNIVSSFVSDIRDQPLLKMDGLITNLPMLRASIDCVEMADMRNGTAVRVPALLQLPRKELADKIRSYPSLCFLNRYSSNSGVAFGCSENEAVLHGLNEVIERHVLSKVLMSLCCLHEQLVLSIPSDGMLDQAFLDHSEFRSVAAGMKILIAKTMYGVYFCLAIPKTPDGRFPLCPMGSGCSVDVHIAIQRASTELLQAMALFDASEKATDLQALALLRRSLKLHPLISLDVLRNIGYACRPIDPPAPKSVADQVNWIVERITATGLTVLKSNLYKFTNGCAVTQVYVPGLERFNLIRAGSPVVPQCLLLANRSVV